MNHQIKIAQSFVSSLLQGGKGASGTAKPKQPKQLFELYDMEGCPYCRRVREVLTLLNLNYICYPCPKGGSKYRPKVVELTGKAQFPFFVDPNTGTQLQESAEIITYLFEHYGNTGAVPKKWQNLPDKETFGTLATLASAMRGLKATKSNQWRTQPETLLELYGFEASPYSRVVRERLCELELPYISHSVAKERWQDMGSAKLRLKPGKYQPKPGGKRERVLSDIMGRLQVPYLIDPNTSVSMFESKDILNYLNRIYNQ